MESLTSGTLAGTGSFRCEECGYVVTLAAADELPTCPGCGSSSFARASLFSGMGGPRFSRGKAPTSGRRRSATPGSTSAREQDHRARPVPDLRTRREDGVDPARARMDARRPQPGRRRPLRRPDRLAPARAHRAPGRRRPGPRRPLAERRLRQRRARRVAGAARRRRDRRGPLPAHVPGRRTGRQRPRRTRRSKPRADRPLAPAAAGEERTRPGRRAGPPLLYPQDLVAETIAILSQKGGTGKTTSVRTLTDVLRRLDLRVLAVDLDPQGNLSDYFDVDPEASPTVGDVLAGPREGQAGRPRRRHPRQPLARRGGAGAGREDGPRADAQARAEGRQARLRRHLPRLPADARAADRQRARRRRLGAPVGRGAVLRDAGRRAGAGGRRAGARQPESGPRMARRRLQHRRHADDPLA